MQLTRVVMFASSTASLLLLAACNQLGAVKQASAPYDPREAHPNDAEIAAHPCRHGDIPRCMEQCKANEPGACNALGVLFEYASDRPSDGALAYGRACDANYAPGCTNLAWLYALGRGVPKDAAQSMALFTKAYEASRLACRRGDTSGCMMAGELLLEGRGVEADEALALSMFEKACDGGERRGCAYVDTLR
jgi:hypothetical protein